MQSPQNAVNYCQKTQTQSRIIHTQITNINSISHPSSPQSIIIQKAPQEMVSQLTQIIGQLSLQIQSLSSQLKQSHSQVLKLKEQKVELDAKIQNLELQIAKDQNRSTKQHEADIENKDNLLIDDQGCDHFGIGDEEEEINIGLSSNNLQLKQSFNILRSSIEKIFNEEDITLSVVRLLPRQLEDDFNDFVSYIKEKLMEIKNQNNLTFIEASNGQEPSIEEIQQQLQDFLIKSTTDSSTKLMKIIEEKDLTINSLMSQKTEQENTITEQQVAQEETQRLYLQQFSVLKNEITLQKQTIDNHTVYYESIKNMLKKMMNLWLNDDDNYDDFEDNLKMLNSVYKFNQKEMELLRKYLKKYKELKGIQ